MYRMRSSNNSANNKYLLPMNYDVYFIQCTVYVLPTKYSINIRILNVCNSLQIITLFMTRTLHIYNLLMGHGIHLEVETDSLYSFEKYFFNNITETDTAVISSP